MSKVVELFGVSSLRRDTDWDEIVNAQNCAYTNKRCYKTRKSDPSVAIGSCSVLYGKEPAPILICPNRLLERRQIFTDCISLLTTHEIGNELHIIPEVKIPGGNVDFFLVSARDGKIRDFVGIELQTMDTTGSVWPERQRLLRDLNVKRKDDAENNSQTFGMNWKMTAKTILVQMHHKITTFEHVNKKLVLVVQDKLLAYMQNNFNFAHFKSEPSISDSMHLHAYKMSPQENGSFKLDFSTRMSTDADGVGICLGLQAEAKVELDAIIRALEAKMSPSTIFTIQ